MGFVFIHPHLRRSQGVAFGVVVDVVVVGLLGALDVGDPGARQDLHAPPALPHLDGTERKLRFHQMWRSELTFTLQLQVFESSPVLAFFHNKCNLDHQTKKI